MIARFARRVLVSLLATSSLFVASRVEAAAPADGKLAGLYTRQRTISLAIGGRLTFNLVHDYFYFFPDGHMLFGVPTEPGAVKEHPTAADFAAFKNVAPEKRGMYEIKGGRITIKPEKGSASTEPFSYPKPGDDSELQIGEKSIVASVKALPFKDGQKLDGTYQFDGTAGLGAATTTFNVSTLTFKPDGMLRSDQLSGIDTQGEKSGATAKNESSNTGAYHLSGYTLETKVGGKTATQTAFRWAGDDEDATPGLICIAGRVYSRQENKK